jgi:hypothetical protein
MRSQHGRKGGQSLKLQLEMRYETVKLYNLLPHIPSHVFRDRETNFVLRNKKIHSSRYRTSPKSTRFVSPVRSVNVNCTLPFASTQQQHIPPMLFYNHNFVCFFFYVQHVFRTRRFRGYWCVSLNPVCSFVARTHRSLLLSVGRSSSSTQFHPVPLALSRARMKRPQSKPLQTNNYPNSIE